MVAVLWGCRVAIAMSDVRLRLQLLAIVDAVLVIVQIWATAPLLKENNKEYWRQFSWSHFLLPLTILSVALLGSEIVGMIRMLLA